MVERKLSGPSAPRSVARPDGVIYLLGMSALACGAAWVAIMLRQLRDRGYVPEVRHLSSDTVEPSELSGVIVVVAVTPALLDEQAGLLRRLAAQATLNIVTGSKLDAAQLLLLRECGAMTVVDSIATAQAAARLVQRFLATVPRTNILDGWDLPWPEAAESPTPSGWYPSQLETRKER